MSQENQESHEYLEYREYNDQEFNNETLKAIALENSEFQGCKFEGCHLSGASFLNSKFVECKFIRCDLSNATLRNATFRDVHFEETKLLGMNWTQTKAISFVNFSNCVLNYSNFVGLVLKGVKITRCVAREVLFTDANLSKADCKETDFAKSEFNGANLTEADFRRALNYQIRPGASVLKKTRFSLPEATTLLYGLDIILED